MTLTKEQRLERASLAINQEVSRIHIKERQRLGQSVGLDQKRARAWCEYGYPSQVTFDMTYMAYRRGGIAAALIDEQIDRCWLSLPVVKDNDDSEEQSAWELDVESNLDESFYREFKEADRRRLIGKFSALLLYFGDINGNNDNWKNKVSSSQLNAVQAVWQSALTPQYSADGKIISWLYQTTNANGGAGQALTVHPDRIFIVGDITPDGTSALEACFNNLINLEKIEGGGGESFLKNASRQISVDFDKEINLKSMATAYGVDESELAGILNDAVEDLNAGNDMMLITQGANVSPLVSNVPDPMNHWDINVNACSASRRMPRAILVGNITGERASTQDQKQWNSRCQSIRENGISPDIVRFIEKMMDFGVIRVKVGFFVEWDNLISASPTEKLEEANLMADIASKTLGLFGSQQVVTLNEIRERIGLPPVEEEEVLSDDIDADISE